MVFTVINLQTVYTRIYSKHTVQGHATLHHGVKQHSVAQCHICMTLKAAQMNTRS